MNVLRGTAGCFNSGCPAEPYVQGGALEFVRAIEGLDGMMQTLHFLRTHYPSVYEKAKPAPVLEYNDFCILPKEMRGFSLYATPPLLQMGFENFAEKKWGLTVLDLHNARAGWCIDGRYAQRIIFPITMGGAVVGFQARSILGESKAKYLTSSHEVTDGRDAECGRPAEAMLYNLDTVQPGSTVVLVEGIADVLTVRRREGRRAVGVLGTRFTTEKLALLKRADPARVIVAFDAEAETEGASERAIRDLISWSISASLGSWKGAKDAGGGGTLEIKDLGLGAALAQKLKP